TNYVSGDAKWFFNEVPVSSGTTYEFSDFSSGNVPSIITVQFRLQNGAFAYKDIASVPASTAFQKNTATFVTPANTVSLTIFHLIKQNGTLTTDEYSLNEVTATPPPPPPSDPQNLVVNGNFETVGANGLPANWIRGGY